MKSILSKNNPIGFFDSGVGGLSVMKKTIELLPHENYIYYGDSKNAPYGVKTVDEVKKLSFKAVEFLLEKGAKAIVIACNTATAAAVEDIRKGYADVPIIGIEPALKPAIELNKNGDILIMATPMTLNEKKFAKLMSRYKEKKSIIPLPCAGLVEFIESGVLEGEELRKFLSEKLQGHNYKNTSSIVLGCTHYPFVKNEIQSIVGHEVDIIDGSLGTAKELKRRLKENNILNEKKEKGNIEIYNSKSEVVELSYKLINL